MKVLIANIFISIIIFCNYQITYAQGDVIGKSYYYTDFSDGTLPEAWSTSVPGYNAAIVEQAFELSISKNSSNDTYILGNLFVEDFDLRPYMTIEYSSDDTLQLGISLIGPFESSSPQEIFTLPMSGEWISYTVNLSALASGSWGYDLDSIRLVFQPGIQKYEGTFKLNKVMIGDSINGKTFRIGLDQPSPFTVDLGNDTTIIAPSTLKLDAGNPGKDFLWNTGETWQTIVVDTSGTYYVSVIGANNCTITDTIQVRVEVEDGIMDQIAGSGLNIYPNPAQTYVNVEVCDEMIGSKLIILDLTGRVLVNKIITGELFFKNISNYPRGLYFVSIPEKSLYIKLYKQ